MSSTLPATVVTLVNLVVALVAAFQPHIASQVKDMLLGASGVISTFFVHEVHSSHRAATKAVTDVKTAQAQATIATQNTETAKANLATVQAQATVNPYANQQG
jgi:hypothetical protein